MTQRSTLEVIAELMTANGWTVSHQQDGGEARVEGVHSSGAAAMATARMKDKGRELRFYAIGSDSRGWTRMKRAGLEDFLETKKINASMPHWRVSSSKCTCGKKSAPTQEQALRMLEEARSRHIRKGSTRVEARVYRCNDDARRWHLTAWASWAGRETWQEATPAR
ncbi:hypothetical protein WKI65_43730 [Streptomyces sp. MS1.AVA.3]|uniref:hypothetical protein n=1 Tax=Streptomyces decoyicus TaxID=249567 RepID=UPI0030C13A9A